MPFYVSPEQAMKDKADYARKAITRIRSGVVITCDAGILFVTGSRSRPWAGTTSSRTCARRESASRT